jgi:hypothetical protein
MWPAMVHSFDIFRILRDDEPLWVEEALTLHHAMTGVKTIGGFTFSALRFGPKRYFTVSGSERGLSFDPTFPAPRTVVQTSTSVFCEWMRY